MSTIPSIDVTIKDNSLGLQDPADGDALAIIGPANAAGLVVNKPLLYGSSSSIEADAIDGPLVEAGCDGLVITGRPVILVRCGTTTAGAFGDIDASGVDGTAVVVAKSGAEPIDDHEAEVLIETGGTIETDGITYYTSLDGGRHYSPLQSLGTATQIDLGGGVVFTLDPPEAELTALIALATEAREETLDHLADVTAHDAADTSSAQVALAASSAPTTAAEAWAVLNLCRAALAAHQRNITVHKGPDPVNVVSHAVATNNSSGVGLAREYKTDFNAHLGIALAASTTGLKAATATVAAQVVWTAADDLLAAGVELLDAYPRRPSFTTGGVTPADAPASVLIEGFDLDGVAQSETLNLSQTAATVTATKAYKGTGLKFTFAAADGTGATISAGYAKGVHNSADATNTISAAAPQHGTFEAGDVWSCRTTMPRPSQVQLDDALKALQQSSYTYETVLILPPILTTAAAEAVKTRWLAMVEAYKYKKLFGAFRHRGIGESAATYLAAFEAQFDTVTCHGISIAAGAEEHQSQATAPRTYMRPASWLPAMWHVQRGPDISIADVAQGAGALPLASTIKDANGNPKHHDEFLEPGLDQARALTLRSWPGRDYVGQTYVTLPRTLGAPGKDFMYVHYWAVMIKALDAAIPRLIGLVQSKGAPDPETGRILEAAAKEIEALVEAEIRQKVTDRGQIVSATVRIDRTVNVFKVDRIPVELYVVPFFYNLGFKFTAMLRNPGL
jgi:hypothetical protein